MLFNQSSIIIASMALLAPLMGACGDVTPRWGEVDEEDPIVLQACRWAGDECIYDDEDDYEEEDQGVDEDPTPDPEPTDECRHPGGCPKPKIDEGGCTRNPWAKGCPQPPKPWEPDGNEWPDGGGDWPDDGGHDGGC